MADFVGLLKKTIDGQSNATPELRQRIYMRARQTVEKKLADSNVAPEIIALQRKVVEKAIQEVEEFYRTAQAAVQKPSYLPEKKENKAVRPAPSAPPVRRAAGFAGGQATAWQQVAAPRAPLVAEVGKTAEGPYVAHTPAEPSGAMFALPENAWAHDKTSGSVPEDEIPPVDDPLPDADTMPEEEYGKGRDAAAARFNKNNNPVSEPGVLPDHSFAGDEAFPVQPALAWQKNNEAGQGYGYRPEPADREDARPFFPDGPVSGYEGYAREGYADGPDFLPLRESAPEPYPEEAGGYETGVALPAEILPVPAGPEISQDEEEPQQLDPAVAAMPSLPEGETSLPVVRTAMLDPVFAELAENQPQGLAVAEEPGRARNPNGDFDLVSGIFAQAAIREKKRSGKKRRLLAGGIIIVILVLGAAIVWFLTGFLQNKEMPQTTGAIVINEPPAPAEARTQAVKLTQRLLPDGRETDPGSAGAQATAGKAANQTISATPAPVADAVFYEARTALLPETSQAGTVEWSILHETSENSGEEMAIRGEVQIPNKDMKLLMTIRRNTDASIPAAYLAELVFVVPENFDGEAVARIGQLVFKASEQSMGQELQGTVVPIWINDNFFFMTINAPGPFLEHNLNIMRQLPWIKLSIQYKNGRYGEFSIAKGEGGDAIFKQVIDSWQAKEHDAIYKARPAGGKESEAQ